MIELPLELLPALAEPLLDCVTVVLLLLLALALPVTTDALLVPVLDDDAELEALPPTLPAVMPLEHSTFPPETLEEAPWLVLLLPLTELVAELPPVLADALPEVLTEADWLTQRLAPLLLLMRLNPWPPLMLDPLESESADAPPELSWLTDVSAPLDASAAPVSTSAWLLPVLSDVASFEQSPPVLPSVEPLESTAFPPLTSVLQFWLVELLPSTLLSAELSPVLASADPLVSTEADWLTSASAPFQLSMIDSPWWCQPPPSPPPANAGAPSIPSASPAAETTARVRPLLLFIRLNFRPPVWIFVPFPAAG